LTIAFFELQWGKVGNSGEFSMFIGEFDYRVDEKGRVPIPPKFRTEELKRDGMVLSPGMDKCITLYPHSEWKKLADSITTGTIVPSKLRKLNRAIFATAFNAEMDAQGRIILPVQLRQHAGITDEVVVAGANSYIELWSKSQWTLEKTASQEEAWHIIETLEKR
jgi:MraZ protein